MKSQTPLLVLLGSFLASGVAGCGPSTPAISKDDLKNIKGGPPPPGLNIGQKMAETKAKWHAAHPEFDKYETGGDKAPAPQAPADKSKT